MTPGIHLFVWLVVAHCLCDYPLQGDFLSRAKRRGGIPGVPWYHALGAHATIHAGAVLLVTGSTVLFAAELLAHAAIDYWKCSGDGSNPVVQAERFDTDQMLHVGCKALWVWAVVLRVA